MTDGGGVFINRETEVEKREGLMINDKKAEERDWENLMIEKALQRVGVFSSIER